VGASCCNVEHVCLTLGGCSAAAIEGGPGLRVPGRHVLLYPARTSGS
jgi:hypothetical protein